MSTKSDQAQINNPLAYVISNLAFIEEEAKTLLEAAQRGETKRVETGWAEVEQALGEARQGAQRVQRIVRDLKTFSRPGDDVDGPVNLKQVIESTLNLCRNEIRHCAQLEIALGESPQVYGNSHRLGQVLLNLLINAYQAMPDGAVNQNRISVRSGATADGRGYVEVEDTGCGIPVENLPRLFDPFFTTKPVGVGTGLGLSICLGILNASGGELQVESVLGKGSTFRMVLKLAREQAPPGPAPVPVRALVRGAVLVVDDEPEVGNAVRRILELEHTVRVVTDASTALSLLAGGERFDCIVSDLMMPRIGGAELFEAVRELDRTQADRMLFVTGGAFTETSQRFMAQMSDRCFEKPFDPEKLRDAVNRSISSGRSRSPVAGRFDT